MDAQLRRRVVERAANHCEYCQLSQEFDAITFHMDHIRAIKHDGPTTFENLALACQSCSLNKGPNAAGYDPETDELTALFNPRLQAWSDHFWWDGAERRGLTPVGRTTIVVLCINDDDNRAIRQNLIDEGEFPPNL